MKLREISLNKKSVSKEKDIKKEINKKNKKKMSEEKILGKKRKNENNINVKMQTRSSMKKKK